MCGDKYDTNTYKLQELEKQRQKVREGLILAGMGLEVIEGLIDSGPTVLSASESNEDALLEYEELYPLAKANREIFEEKKQQLASIDEKIQQLNAEAEV